MPGGIREVHPAAAVAVVDLAGPFGARVRPVLQAARLDLAVDRVELLLGDQECVVLPPDLLAFGDVGVIETGAVIECDNHEVAEWLRARQAEEFGEKLRGFLFVACRDNGVVETDGHSSFQSNHSSTTRVNAHATLGPYFGAVSSKAMLSGSRNSRMYDGPMSLIGSCATPSSSRCADGGIQFVLAGQPERDVVQAGAILVEAVGGHRAQPEQGAAEVVDDPAVQEAQLVAGFLVGILGDLDQHRPTEDALVELP